MIAVPNQPATSPVPNLHASFLAMLPAITRYAGISFRSLRPEAKSEAVQEVIANSFVGKNGKESRANILDCCIIHNEIA